MRPAKSFWKNVQLCRTTCQWLCHLTKLVNPGAKAWFVTRYCASNAVGQEYRDPKDFKREMVKALRAVCAVYPDARVEQVAGGLVLLPSRSPVPKTMFQIAGPRG